MKALAKRAALPTAAVVSLAAVAVVAGIAFGPQPHFGAAANQVTAPPAATRLALAEVNTLDATGGYKEGVYYIPTDQQISSVAPKADTRAQFTQAFIDGAGVRLHRAPDLSSPTIRLMQWQESIKITGNAQNGLTPVDVRANKHHVYHGFIASDFVVRAAPN